MRVGDLKDVQAIPLRTNSRLERFIDKPVFFTFNYCEKPDRQIRVYVTDPEDGFYIISDERSEHLQNLGQYSDGVCQDFGQVKYIALSANKQMLALYTDCETTGTVIGILSDLSREFTRLPTG